MGWEQQMSLQTEYVFSLPRGYLDEEGSVHRQGCMRLATARDEIESLLHPQVQARPAYLPVVLLSRVLTSLGNLPAVTPVVVEGLFAADLAYLEDLYQRLNAHEAVTVEAVCPSCSHVFHLQVAPLDEEPTLQ
jgi:hypothetical protein